MTENRKIAAILVADVVGYSPLVGADEEGTLARLRALLGDPRGRRHRLLVRWGEDEGRQGGARRAIYCWNQKSVLYLYRSSDLTRAPPAAR
jgi:hypothetical protein